MKKNLVVLLALLPFLSHGIKPVRKYYLRPDSLNLAYREKQLPTPDGATLFSWVLPTPASHPLKTTLVLAYGDSGNMSSTLYLAKGLLEAGFDLLLFDYRGFGQSSDFAVDTTRFYYAEFAVDLLTATNAARREFPANRLGIWSFSMGTIVATLAAQKTAFAFIVADCYVKSPEAAVAFWQRTSGKKLTLPASARDVPSLSRKIACPMLFFAGTEDDVTPLRDARSVAAQRPNRRVVVYQGWHSEAMKALTKTHFADMYIAEIVRFVRR